jgi:hypothetical protein
MPPPGHRNEDRQATVRVDLGVGDADAEEIDGLRTGLRRELLDLDVERVERVPAGEPPAGARAFEVFALGSLVVTLVRNRDALKAVVQTLQRWLARDERRTIRLELDGDTLEVTRASSEEQERLISGWLARHSRA